MIFKNFSNFAPDSSTGCCCSIRHSAIRFPTGASTTPIPAKSTTSPLQERCLQTYSYSSGRRRRDIPCRNSLRQRRYRVRQHIRRNHRRQHGSGSAHVRDLSAVPSDNSVELSWSASDVTIRTAGNNVVVTGLTTGTVTVISPDGRCLTTAEAAPVVTLPLAHGIYIVNAGNTTAKIVIK